ncbi:GGDEF domain-containing protein [Paraburkholderia tropica]|uniref:diguanylate cyclase n=2 Tax=Burkholderiaceae TaxID=119060 RepID=A0ABX5MIA7_9BURK|nr:sensor domain-containing diguanylate cyclase [Paraburkholderia tropica]MDE1144360.1 sensor domain-containing diguanylate cyclase [Paraburkholderia tropica]PXX08315.1 diguanylate cyclase [Paraburkholderia tropica]PZW73671.1 diguanylate cyclase [Paraburkholderia tropica]
MDGLLIGPATRRQAIAAALCALAILLALALAAPRARDPLPPVAPFMPMCALTVFTTSGIAAFLLGGRFAATRLPMLGALGGAYAFTAIAVALQLLMFPGVFTRSGLLGAGPHSAAWMWVFWHAGFPVFVIVAASVRNRANAVTSSMATASTFGGARGWLLVAGPAVLAALLGVLVIQVDFAQPWPVAHVAAPGGLTVQGNPLAAHAVGIVIGVLNLAAIAVVLLKGRLRLVLDLWIVVALLASFVDVALNTLSVERFTLGWYVARVFSMFAPGVLVCVLVWEVTALYRRLAQEHASLVHSSAHDALTRIYNRSYFDEQFRREVEQAARADRPLSLVMIDVDHFKQYNDAYGHLHGDACLGAVAGALASTLRRPGEFVARYGGEEFALVLPDTPADEAGTIAERARAAVARLAIAAPSPDGHVTVSAGCATRSPLPVTVDDTPNAGALALIEAADAALYAAKRAGRNRIARADASLA